MKKFIFVCILIIVSNINSFAQLDGISFKGAEEFNPFKYEVLMKLSDTSYVIPYETTVIGLKHCFDKAKEILSFNNKNFYKPDMSDELIDEKIDIDNYKNLHLSVWSGESEIFRVWKFNKISMTLVIQKNTRAILFLKIQ